MAATIQVRLSPWGQWFRDFIQRPLDDYDIAGDGLRCAIGLPGMDTQLVGLGVDKLNDWTDAVEQFTKKLRRKFQRRRHRQGEFLVAAMVECIQRKLGVQYNYDFMEGEYDASDSRNLFIHGPLTGFGGTCNSLPVVYVAIARRLQYPISLAQTKDHAFCRWDGPGRESFCFDAAGKGFLAHKEERYRQWPHRITAREEERNGYIRAMSKREELAFFASNRGNCLMDNFDFVSAVEAYHWAHELEPDKQSINDTLGLAIYSAQIWRWMMKLPDQE